MRSAIGAIEGMVQEKGSR